MRQKSHSTDLSSEEIVKGIRRATRKRYSAVPLHGLLSPVWVGLPETVEEPGVDGLVCVPVAGGPIGAEPEDPFS